MQEKTVRYSEAFKLQVIKELDRGDFRSIAEARQRYGISGGSTINKWLKKYRRADILPKRTRTRKEKMNTFSIVSAGDFPGSVIALSYSQVLIRAPGAGLLSNLVESEKSFAVSYKFRATFLFSLEGLSTILSLRFNKNIRCWISKNLC